MQGALSAGDADIHQAALLLHLARLGRFAMRQDAFLDANQKNMGILESLRGMQRRKLHGIDFLVVLLVEHVDQGDALRQLDQRLAVEFALLVDPVGKFADIGPARLCHALLLMVIEVGFVVDGFQEVGQHQVGRFPPGPLLHAIDELPEFEQGFELARRDAVREAFLEGCREQRDMPLAGVGAEHLQGCRADAALGCRGGADVGRVVVLVGQQAQVGDDVLDLGLVEEGLAA